MRQLNTCPLLPELSERNLGVGVAAGKERVEVDLGVPARMDQGDGVWKGDQRVRRRLVEGDPAGRVKHPTYRADMVRSDEDVNVTPGTFGAETVE